MSLCIYIYIYIHPVVELNLSQQPSQRIPTCWAYSYHDRAGWVGEHCPLHSRRIRIRREFRYVYIRGRSVPLQPSSGRFPGLTRLMQLHVVILREVSSERCLVTRFSSHIIGHLEIHGELARSLTGPHTRSVVLSGLMDVEQSLQESQQPPFWEVRGVTIECNSHCHNFRPAQ